jgi:recombination protein RecA
MNAIPTGSISLDVALGIGGVPRGAISEIFGPEACGKTTLAQHIVAEAQRQGGAGAFIDMENALDPNYARACGVDVENLLLAQPATGEQALDIAETLAQSGAVDVIVIDSVAALVPRAELQGEMGETHTGLIARLMSQALRKISRAIEETGTAVVFTNQIRDRISDKHAKTETTTGGRALKFHAAVRMSLHNAEAIQRDSKTIGNRTNIKIVKNQFALTHQTAEFDIIYNRGISKASEIVRMAIELEILEQRNSMYHYRGMALAEELNETEERLRQDRELATEIEERIRQECLPPPPMPLET